MHIDSAKAIGYEASEVHSSFRSCLVVFAVQTILIYAIKLALGDLQIIVPARPSILAVRFICTLLISLQVEKKISSGQLIMKYVVNHHKKFRTPVLAWLIGFLQCISTQMTLIACILFISTISRTIDVIIKFVALATIAKFDNFYYNSVPWECKVSLG
jgi:hypothetical protein